MTLGLIAGLFVTLLAADSEALIHPFTADTEIVSDSGGALEEVSIHYRQDFHEESFETLSDLISSLPPEVTIHIVVAHRSEFDNLAQHLSDAGICDESRLDALITGFEISPWSKDRYGTLQRRGRPVMAVPPYRAAVRGVRGNDEKVPDVMCSQLDHVRCHAMPLFFEGGDLMADENHVFVAATLLERNAPLTEDRRTELLIQLEEELQRIPVQIGRNGRDVPDHHIGMYLTPLGGGLVAVANPRLGARLYRQLPEEEQVLELDDDPDQLERFDRVAEDLRSQGIEVVEVPLLVTRQARVFVSYNNALLETRDGRATVYMPVYGIDSLDAAAAAVFEEQGWDVEPVRVQKVFRHTGSLRCLVGVVSRT